MLTFSVAVVVLEGYRGGLFKNEKKFETYHLSNLVLCSLVLKVHHV